MATKALQEVGNHQLPAMSDSRESRVFAISDDSISFNGNIFGTHTHNLLGFKFIYPYHPCNYGIFGYICHKNEPNVGKYATRFNHPLGTRCRMESDDSLKWLDLNISFFFSVCLFK